MIRSTTAMSCVLAGAAVLYTYQSKHNVQLLDRQIEKTLAETTGLREQSRALRAEWTLRENPERLRAFSDQYLALRPMLPEQFTTLVELASRLPAPRAWEPTTGTTDAPEEPAVVPVAAAQPSAATLASAAEESVVAEEELPIPPLPVAAPPALMATNAAPPAPKPAPPRSPVAAPAPTPAPPIQTARTPLAAAQQQPPRVAATATPPLQAPQQPPVQTGSLLAVGRGSSFAPVPRPMPVSTNQWNNGN